jgi:hypothetical protein
MVEAVTTHLPATEVLGVGPRESEPLEDDGL